VFTRAKNKKRNLCAFAKRILSAVHLREPHLHRGFADVFIRISEPNAPRIASNGLHGAPRAALLAELS
jgi:hypothetical protein